MEQDDCSLMLLFRWPKICRYLQILRIFHAARPSSGPELGFQGGVAEKAGEHSLPFLRIGDQRINVH